MTLRKIFCGLGAIAILVLVAELFIAEQSASNDFVDAAEKYEKTVDCALGERTDCE